MACTAYSCQEAGSSARKVAATVAPVSAGEDGERARLSKAAVISEALKLADADGLDALTIRKLATHLGVTPMALYWHFRSKDELLDAVADQVWSEIDVNTDLAAPWAAQLRRMLESLVSVLRAHPAGFQLLTEHEVQNPASLVATERALEILRSAGFDAKHASAIARATLWAGLMLVRSEPGFEPGLSEAERTELQRKNHITLAMQPPEIFPRIVECATAITDMKDLEFHYRLGIDMFIAGVESLAAKGSGAAP
jgi:TetR/AcrR family transcriptional regulator, tetracycline repressor protein